MYVIQTIPYNSYQLEYHFTIDEHEQK